MGNLPCCDANEQSKPNALSAPSSSSHQHHNYPNNGQHNHNDPFASTTDASGGIITGIHPSLNQHQHGIGIGIGHPHHLNPNNLTSKSDKFQLEEQQRALHQEQERLARIVNDANQNMVPLNGSSSSGIHGHSGHSLGSVSGSGSGGNLGGSSGRNDSSKMRMGVGYYDANYAAEVWQDLIPGRNNGGGLIHRCQAFMTDSNSGANANNNDVAVDEESHLEFPRVKGALKNEHMVDALAFMPQMQQNGHEDGQGLVWNEDAVQLLNELIYVNANSNVNAVAGSNGNGNGNGNGNSNTSGNGTGAATGTLRANEGMEMLVDDLAERFLAIVFQEQRGFQGLPIVENVL